MKLLKTVLMAIGFTTILFICPFVAICIGIIMIYDGVDK